MVRHPFLTLNEVHLFPLLQATILGRLCYRRGRISPLSPLIVIPPPLWSLVGFKACCRVRSVKMTVVLRPLLQIRHASTLSSVSFNVSGHLSNANFCPPPPPRKCPHVRFPCQAPFGPSPIICSSLLFWSISHEPSPSWGLQVRRAVARGQGRCSWRPVLRLLISFRCFFPP